MQIRAYVDLNYTASHKTDHKMLMHNGNIAVNRVVVDFLQCIQRSNEHIMQCSVNGYHAANSNDNVISTSKPVVQ